MRAARVCSLGQLTDGVLRGGRPVPAQRVSAARAVAGERSGVRSNQRANAALARSGPRCGVARTQDGAVPDTVRRRRPLRRHRLRRGADGRAPRRARAAGRADRARRAVARASWPRSAPGCPPPARTGRSSRPTPPTPPRSRRWPAATRVVATTVGPYAKYGLPLVEACARAGTHYADLTGEVLFVREAIDRFDDARPGVGRADRALPAASTRSRRTWRSCCCTSARPRTARAGCATSGWSRPARRVQRRHDRLDPRAGRHVRRDPRGPAAAADPFALSPDRAAEPDAPQPPDAGRPARDRRRPLDRAVRHGAFNTRIVRRSNALQDWAYGRELRLLRGDGHRPRAARGGGRGRGGGRAGRLPRRDGAPADPRPARPRAARAGHGPERGDRDAGGSAMAVDAATESGRRYRAEIGGRATRATPRPR